MARILHWLNPKNWFNRKGAQPSTPPVQNHSTPKPLPVTAQPRPAANHETPRPPSGEARRPSRSSEVKKIKVQTAQDYHQQIAGGIAQITENATKLSTADRKAIETWVARVQKAATEMEKRAQSTESVHELHNQIESGLMADGAELKIDKKQLSYLRMELKNLATIYFRQRPHR